MLAIEPSRIPVALGSSFVARDVCRCAWRQFERKAESRGCLWQNNLGASVEITFLQTVQFQEKEAAKFVTPSGVTAFFATSLPQV